MLDTTAPWKRLWQPFLLLLCMTSVCINAISFILRNDYVVFLHNTWLAIHCLLQHPDTGCYNEQSEIAINELNPLLKRLFVKSVIKLVSFILALCKPQFVINWWYEEKCLNTIIEILCVFVSGIQFESPLCPWWTCNWVST